MPVLFRSCGCILALGGALLLLMCFAFASMIDPEIRGWARMAEIVRSMVEHPETWFALGGLVAGGLLMFGKLEPAASRGGKPAPTGARSPRSGDGRRDANRDLEF